MPTSRLLPVIRCVAVVPALIATFALVGAAGFYLDWSQDRHGDHAGLALGVVGPVISWGLPMLLASVVALVGRDPLVASGAGLLAGLLGLTASVAWVAGSASPEEDAGLLGHLPALGVVLSLVLCASSIAGLVVSRPTTDRMADLALGLRVVAAILTTAALVALVLLLCRAGDALIDPGGTARALGADGTAAVTDTPAVLWQTLWALPLVVLGSAVVLARPPSRLPLLALGLAGAFVPLAAGAAVALGGHGGPVLVGLAPAAVLAALAVAVLRGDGASSA